MLKLGFYDISSGCSVRLLALNLIPHSKLVANG